METFRQEGMLDKLRNMAHGQQQVALQQNVRATQQQQQQQQQLRQLHGQQLQHGQLHGQHGQLHGQQLQHGQLHGQHGQLHGQHGQLHGQQLQHGQLHGQHGQLHGQLQQHVTHVQRAAEVPDQNLSLRQQAPPLIPTPAAKSQFHSVQTGDSLAMSVAPGGPPQQRVLGYTALGAEGQHSESSDGGPAARVEANRYLFVQQIEELNRQHAEAQSKLEKLLQDQHQTARTLDQVG